MQSPQRTLYEIQNGFSCQANQNLCAHTLDSALLNKSLKPGPKTNRVPMTQAYDLRLEHELRLNLISCTGVETFPSKALPLIQNHFSLMKSQRKPQSTASAHTKPGDLSKQNLC